MIQWPRDKKFAFTIVDDTDNCSIENTKPVYDFLYDHGILTTKTVWIYKPRDNFTGACLEDIGYLDWIKNLNRQGFEIALHNIGSGDFNKNEIESGFAKFKKLLGYYPRMHINHAKNKDNIYWGSKRFSFPLSLMMKVLNRKDNYSGEDPASNFFWGDICKKNIKYIRNKVFNGINTISYDPKMPYVRSSTKKYSNFWFSSSDAHTLEEFNFLLTPKNLDRLERERGFSILYTHFASGFVDSTGALNQEFKKRIIDLARRDGWFVPASSLLDFILESRSGDTEPGWLDLATKKWTQVLS